MLRYTIRRILWAIPTIFGISIVAFLVTTLIPEPPSLSLAEQRDALDRDPASYDAYVESRRQHALDVPTFVNPKPRDVRTIVADCVDHLAKNDERAAIAAHDLARTGAAAFPHLLPTLDRLAPDARKRVAMALLPIAVRMGQDDLLARNPETASRFWVQFWEDRSLEFTEPAVRRSVVRLVRGGTEGRERDLIEVDTFAMPALITAMHDPTLATGGLARLSAVASHVSGHGVTVPLAMTAEGERRIRRDWAEWWSSHHDDYVALDGGERIFATLAETRYGRWLFGAATGQLGTSVRDGEPIGAKLGAAAPITLSLVLVSMLLSFAVAVPVGVLSARRRGQPVDLALAAVLFLFYSLPNYFFAEVLVHMTHDATIGVRVILATLTMTLVSVATLSRFQRASMLDVLGQDFVRTAHAKGLTESRVLIFHALRNAIVPTVTLAGLQLPVAFGAAIVVEEVFALPGLGYETMRAVEAHDGAWLVVVVLVVSLATTASLLASDVAYGFLDPRIRERLTNRREEVL